MDVNSVIGSNLRSSALALGDSLGQQGTQSSSALASSGSNGSSLISFAEESARVLDTQASYAGSSSQAQGSALDIASFMKDFQKSLASLAVMALRAIGMSDVSITDLLGEQAVKDAGAAQQSKSLDASTLKDSGLDSSTVKQLGKVLSK